MLPEFPAAFFCLQRFLKAGLRGVGCLKRRLGIGHLHQTHVEITMVARVAFRFFTSGSGCDYVSVVDGYGSPAARDQPGKNVSDRCFIAAAERIRLARVRNRRWWI